MNLKFNVNSFFLIFLISIYLTLIISINTTQVFAENNDFSNINLLKNNDVIFWKDNLNITIIPIFNNDFNTLSSADFKQNIFDEMSNYFEDELIVIYYDEDINEITIFQSKTYLSSLQLDSLKDIFEMKKSTLENNEFVENMDDVYKENVLFLVNNMGEFILSNNDSGYSLKTTTQINLNQEKTLSSKINNKYSFSTYVIIYTIIFLVILLIILSFFYIKLSKKEFKPTILNENIALKTYIYDLYNKGYNLDQIKVYLLQNNYTENEINAIMDTIKR
jgi:hypothetical protein